MLRLILLSLTLTFFIVDGQRNCQSAIDSSTAGTCTDLTACQGAAINAQVCEQRICCVSNYTIPTGIPNCFDQSSFTKIYNTSRGSFTARVLNYAIYRAGICNNCRATAAFLAIAAAMTNNFQNDEALGTSISFSIDDRRFGNSVAGDGSLYRRRGFFGIRGKTWYERIQSYDQRYPIFTNPQLASNPIVAAEIAAILWQNPTLHAVNRVPLTNQADGSFYGLSMLWYTLTRGTESLSEIAKKYSFFLRLFQCGGDLFPGQGGSCQINATTSGTCVPICLGGMEDIGEACGCGGDVSSTSCAGGPSHIRCCADLCSQELKMDLGLVLDSSGSITEPGYELLRSFVKALLGQVNVGRNKTHVGIINYSSTSNILTYLNRDFDLREKLRIVDAAPFIGSGTNTAAALQQASTVFDPRQGLRKPEEGVTQIIFVITDGESADERATINAASVLKQKGIHIISVGVGSELNLRELYAMATTPVSENYFPIADYTSLTNRLNQFVSRSCSEPATIPSNTTVTGEVIGGKYKYFKLKIVVNGNKVMIKVKLVVGKVKLFYSFTSRNPKDPLEFIDVSNITVPTGTTTGATPAGTSVPGSSAATSRTSFVSTSTSSTGGSTPFFNRFFDFGEFESKATKEEENFVSVVIDKPADMENFDSVFVGVKGAENENKFELTLEDCSVVFCPTSGTVSKHLSSMIGLICLFLSMRF